jgi:hypothetical protein
MTGPVNLVRRLAGRRLMVGSLTLTLAAFGLMGGSPVSSVAAPAAHAVAPECLSGARVRGGSDGADPNSLTRSEAAAAERALDARARARGLASRSEFAGVTVDVHVHVITRNNGRGGVTMSQVAQQIRVLNAAFAGRSAEPSAPTGFRFRLDSLDYTPNTDWYNWSSPDVNADDDREAKRALHRGGWKDLNIYIAGLQDGLLGYASFPFDTTLRRDGVVLLNESLPGGTAVPYNLGDTATHEVGHWLGLYHTFQDGCRAPGDYVPDTPYQDDGDNIFECDETLDTCSRPGRDPVHNFMSYGDDQCLDRFTSGQAVRMALIWYLFRDPTALP